MARVVYGARGAVWRAPEWIVRNFCSEVIPILHGMSVGAVVARQLAEMLEGDLAVIDLTRILEDPQLRGAWLAALDTAVLLMSAEPPGGWNEPQAFAPFIGSIRRFVDAEHARPLTAALPATADQAVIGTLPWILDDVLDR